jgi:iron(III) transport system permease protein
LSTKSDLTLNAEPLRGPGASGAAAWPAPAWAPVLARRFGAALLALAAVFPSAYLLLAALPIVSDGGWLAHFASTTLPQQALTSLMVALEASAVAFAAGAIPAVAVSRFDFRFRKPVCFLSLLPLLFAPFVTANLWTVYFSGEFFEGRHALACELGLACSPYVFIVFRIAGARIPTSFAELAAALGHGPWGRLRHVHAPSYAVPVAAGLLIVFAESIGDYAAAERLGIQTLSQGIHNLWFASQSSAVAAIVSSVLIVPTVVLVLVGAWASTSIISQNPIPPVSAASARKPLSARAASLLLAWSVAWSLPGFFIPEVITWRWAWLRWPRTRFADIPGDTLNTAVTSLATVLMVFATCALVAIVMRLGARSRWSERMPWLFLANYFLPSLVLALAFVMMSRDGSVGAQLLGPLRDSRLLIVAAEALRFMPFAMLPALDALQRTPPAMIEAARALGAGPLRARALAFAGHLQPALVLGCALVFMESVKELDLSLTLQPFGYSSLALKIYAFSRNQNMDRAAVWVLITQGLMLLPLLLLYWRLDKLGSGPRKA